ncbi:MAG: hypothetical protein KA226_09345 [Gemmatimonadales bacterium]|nr:hypothetical protein [Gemmatimonadales bacterium]
MSAPDREWHLEPDSGPDLRFTGRQVAEVSSFEDGRNQWSVLRLYRTVGGGYVVVRERFDEADPAEPMSMAAQACADAAAVVAYLHGGPQRASWLTKNLLDQAGIDHAQVVP